MRITAAGCLAVVLSAACGGSPKPTEAPEPAASAAPEASPAAAAPAAAEPTAAEPAAEEAKGDEAKPEPGEKKALKGREITYRPTGEGLVIEVEGVKLEPKATPLKLKDGWGLKLTLKATSTDGHMHKLLKSNDGPLMVFAEIDRAGKKERKADQRKGDAEEFLPPGDETEFVQNIEYPVWGNQSLTLHVGLWGLGRDDDERRPVKKLCIVKMVPGTSGKPSAIVSPPE